MPTVSTTELVNRAKAAADMHDDFVTPAQWMYWASQERMSLDLLLARSGWALDFETATITVAGTESGAFELISDTDEPIVVMAIVAVHEYGSAGTRLLTYSDSVGFLAQLPTQTIVTGHPSKYRIRRNEDSLVFNFFPNPTTGLTFVVTYVPHPLKLTTDANLNEDEFTDSVTYPMGWEERIVLGMARRALEKEESDSGPLMRQLQQIDAEIEELCWSRVMSANPTIRNVDYQTRGWGCLLYTSPSPRDLSTSRMPSSA